jgi:hypothetical protein
MANLLGFGVRQLEPTHSDAFAQLKGIKSGSRLHLQLTFVNL